MALPVSKSKTLCPRCFNAVMVVILSSQVISVRDFEPAPSWVVALPVLAYVPDQRGEPMSEARRGEYRSTPRGLAAVLPHYGCGCYRSLCRKLDGVSDVRLLTASVFSWAWLHAQVIHLRSRGVVCLGSLYVIASVSGPLSLWGVAACVASGSGRAIWLSMFCFLTVPILYHIKNSLSRGLGTSFVNSLIR